MWVGNDARRIMPRVVLERWHEELDLLLLRLSCVCGWRRLHSCAPVLLADAVSWGTGAIKTLLPQTQAAVTSGLLSGRTATTRLLVARVVVAALPICAKRGGEQIRRNRVAMRSVNYNGAARLWLLISHCEKDEMIKILCK